MASGGYGTTGRRSTQPKHSNVRVRAAHQRVMRESLQEASTCCAIPSARKQMNQSIGAMAQRLLHYDYSSEGVMPK